MPTHAPINQTVQISARAAAQISKGSLWIFSNEISGKFSGIEPGTLCWFESNKQMVGTGYINPHSLIAGRLLSRNKELEITSLLKKKLAEAFARRKGGEDRGSFRLVFSEADFLPGIILDFYSGVAVLQSNTAGADKLLDILEVLVPEVYRKVFKKDLSGFVLRGDSSIRTLEGIVNFSRVVSGEEASLRRSFFTEDGLFFEADFLEGQKTGFFLDQKDNRSFLERFLSAASKPKVLDLFCYSGGWGFRALRAGAEHVQFVDQSEEALGLVKDGIKKNNFDESRTSLVKQDVFDFLESSDDSYDVIVADPPAFVKSKKNLPQAKKAYEKLNRLCWRRLRPGALLLSSSCSYHLSESEFVEMLSFAISKEEGFAHIVFRGLQATDHPILLSMPETRYLKCFGLQKL